MLQPDPAAIPELHVSFPQDVVYLYPNDQHHREQGGELGDTTVSTIVISVTLQTPVGARPLERISRLSVEAIGRESLNFSRVPVETSEVCYDRRQADGAHMLPVAPGATYRWDVPLEIHSNATPYENTQHGRVYQSIRVGLEWETGHVYRKVVAEKRIWITCIPHPSNFLDYAKTHEAAIETLGPVRIQITSPHLTVGGHLRLDLSLPSPARSCKVQRVRVCLAQTVTLQSRKTPSYDEPCPSGVMTIANMGEYDLGQTMRATEGTGLHLHKLVRISSEDAIRPSTLPASQTCIRVSHKLVVYVHFNHGKKTKSLAYSAQWPITLSSCSCRWHSLKLPAYSRVDPSGGHQSNPTDECSGPGDNLNNPDCACKASMEDLLQIEEEILKAHPWVATTDSGVRPDDGAAHQTGTKPGSSSGWQR